MFSSTSPSVTLLQRKKLATIRLLSLRKVLVVLTAARRETGPLVPAGQSRFWVFVGHQLACLNAYTMQKTW